MGRSLRRAGVLTLALAVVAPGVATAGWTGTAITSNTHFDEPSLAIDAADVSHLAYIAYGDEPGLFFATDATGRWVSTRLTSATDDAPAIALDSSGHDHVVFVRSGSGAGIYYATDRTGDWVVTRLSHEAGGSPSIAVDAGGHVHIAFASDSFEPGIVSLDDTTGSWTRTQVTAAPLDSATAIAVLGDGSSKIAFARYAPEAPGIYVASAAKPGGPWTLERLTSAYDDDPALVVRANGEADVAFVRFQSTGRGLYYAAGTTSWTITPVRVDESRFFERPSLAVDRRGRPAIVYTLADADGDPLGLFRADQGGGGSWTPDVPVTSYGNADDWASLALDSADGVRVAFAELDAGPNPGVYVRDAVKAQVVATSTVDTDVSMTAVGDDHVIAFRHLSGGSDRGVRYGQDTGGTWTFETATSDAAAPSVVVDDAWHARIFGGDSTWARVGGTWVGSKADVFGRDVHATRDAAGNTWLTYQTTTGDPMLASDRGGAWTSASGYYGFDGNGAVAVDAGGRIHWVIAGDTLAYQTASRLDGPWSERRLGSNATDPAIALDGDGKVHIVWRRVTSDQGLYYTTNRSGTWVTTRLTRTSAEGRPALALDSTGHVYVAVVRHSSAASPGLYLITNRTGDWVTSWIDGGYDDLDPQLAVDAAGHATVVLGHLGSGLVAYDQPDFAMGSLPIRWASGPREGATTRGALPGRPTATPGATDRTSSPPTAPHEHGVGTQP